MKQRLQKILSQAGICSRRQAEDYLLAGRICVNGVVASLGDGAVPGEDEITVDGVSVFFKEERVYLMLNKPQGYVTTLSDEKGRPTVAQLVQAVGVRVWPVGRLDYQTEGLLILCNDGELTQTLTHPGHGVEKEYYVWVAGDVARALPVLTNPMTVEGERFLPAQVTPLKQDGKQILSIVIHEGKNRQVRRMCAHAGLKVRRLKRVREGNLRLDPALAPGSWRPLTPEEVHMLHTKF